MRIGVATVFTPGLRGGAEFLADGLVDALKRAGHQIHRIEMPFFFSPPAATATAMEAWATQDHARYGGGRIDRMICLKFPAYLLEHPNKIVWLLHQHRPAYDLYDTPHGFSSADPAQAKLREAIVAGDNEALSGAKAVYTIAETVCRRLMRDNGIASRAVYHPPANAEEFRSEDPLPYIFFPSRIETLKRQELLVRAMAKVRAPVTAVFAGDGGQRGHCEALAAKLGVADRVRFLGAVDRAHMIELYARSLGVFFGPFDEDYGYVTLEAMLSGKPVITCSDSGGPLEFVVDGETGIVSEPEADAVADAVDRLFSDWQHAARLGENGRARYEALGISWDNAVNTLAGDRS
jgi:glycosyltransferase involved in cell wall biosynthesis